MYTDHLFSALKKIEVQMKRCVLNETWVILES
jgi:hypothetical protein